MNNEILISARKLSRFYGDKIAIRDVTFNVHRGEILGFLGPNGAGKSTTMQIISGVLAASHGEISIAGYDIRSMATKAKRNIGFLPERPPLYHDLTVDEYLLYAAGLRGVEKEKRGQALRFSKGRCGLEQVAGHLIRNLSEGYRQRVGIAQAIIHAPPVIILDEPTSGLDPIQIKEIRGLLRELGQDHSVILSTHILSEVQSLCDRVLIINKGRIVLDRPLQQLQKDGPDYVEIGLRWPPSPEILLKIKGVNSAENIDQETFLLGLDTDRRSAIVDTLLEKAVREKWGLYKLNPGDTSLETVFIHLTSIDGEEEKNE